MKSCCHTPDPSPQPEGDHCAPQKRRFDWLLWGSLALVAAGYGGHLFAGEALSGWAVSFAATEFELMNRMWWGLVLGILFVGILGVIPKEFVTSALGKGGSFRGVLRATVAGVALDLCSHGILLVGMRLYERGASLGQVMAFLIASPWNSFSLTLILWALIGFKWMVVFLLLSLVVAIVSGVVFDRLVARGILPANPHGSELPEGFKFWSEAGKKFKNTKPSGALFARMVREGLAGSRMILRWIFFGVVLASLIRAFVPTEHFATYFGPTLMGLALTLVAATVIEVCSEGSTPIAAELLTRAGAPGNSFTFLMTGVSTDYTEIMGLRETTGSWKIALFLPLVTVPQVMVLGYLLNLAR